MLHINKWNIDSGAYVSKNSDDIIIVVTEIITHQDTNGELFDISDDPYIVYRDLIFKIDNHQMTIMRLSEFRKKFKKV